MGDDDGWSGETPDRDPDPTWEPHAGAEPDEHGYGHYDVDVDVDVDVDDPPSRQPPDPFAAPPAEPAVRSDGPPAPTSDGRVPFADRNWRVPAIIAVVAALVVVVSVVLLLPDDDTAVEPEVAGLVELREQPSKQWDEDLDGFAVDMATDADAVFVLVTKQSTTEVTAFDVGTGDERWTADLEIAPSSQRDGGGSLAVVDDRLFVVVEGPGTSGRFLALDPSNGSIRWRVPFESAESSVEAGPLVRSIDRAGRLQLTAIDDEGKRLGETVPADVAFAVDDWVYVDVDGLLVRRSLDGLERDAAFAFSHAGVVAAVTEIGGEPVVATGERIVRLDGDGGEQYATDAGVGIVTSLMAVTGDAVVVGGSGRVRVVAIDDGSAEPVTDVRSGVEPLDVVTVDGEELVVAFDGVETGAAEGSLQTLRVDGDRLAPASAIELSTLDGPPAMTVVGATLYAVSNESPTKFIAADVGDGRRLWSIVLGDGDRTLVGASGVIVLSEEDDESVLAVYASNG